MHLLVTGGAGYIGAHLCALLRERNIPHAIFDNLSTGHAEQVFQSPLIRGDICDASAVAAALASGPFTGVVNLAALATLPACEAAPELCANINVGGVSVLLSAMQKAGIQHFVQASSCAVYAPSDAPLSETCPLGPESRYGQSKQAAEALLAQSGMAYIALRLFNVAGAHASLHIGECHEPETHLLPLALAAALGKRDKLALFGQDYPTPDGTAVRDYIHVCDVASAMLRSMEHLHSGGTSAALNLGSGVGVSVRQLLARVEAATGKDVPHTLAQRRPGDVPALVCDTSLMRQTLGFEPQYSAIDRIIVSALQWHAKH